MVTGSLLHVEITPYANSWKHTLQPVTFIHTSHPLNQMAYKMHLFYQKNYLKNPPASYALNVGSKLATVSRNSLSCSLANLTLYDTVIAYLKKKKDRLLLLFIIIIFNITITIASIIIIMCVVIIDSFITRYL